MNPRPNNHHSSSHSHNPQRSHGHAPHASHASRGSQANGTRRSFNRGGRPNFHRGGPGGRPSFNRGGFGGRGGNRGKRGGFEQKIDTARFVNKAAPVEAEAPFVPKHAFADFAVDQRLKANIAAKGYVSPTPIQDAAIPHILQGKDIVGIANTGTGKTAAFLIPLINKLILDPRQKALVMAPTRELAQQIEAELKGFAGNLNLHAVCAVGGASMGFQLRALSRRPRFIIGTPGRLKDLIERKAIDLSQFATVVLDEADRMLDMGFIHDVKFMMSRMPAARHTLFFSATMSREIEALIKDFLNDPVMVSVKTRETSKQIDQDVVRVPSDRTKLQVLFDILAQPGFDKVLVFGKTKHGVQRLADQLSQRGFKAEAIHGNKSQNQRVRALKLFKEHHVKILVATDVAARGLDIAGVSHVINYDIPATYEDYVHRIGRTGRAGKTGKALTFV